MKIGTKLVDVRNMTQKEIDNEGWDYYSQSDNIKALVFDDGSVVYPSMDYEGNGPGAIFGYKNVKGKPEHFAF